MVYSRGHPLDYDEWAELGAAGWSWEEVLPYFKRSEKSWRGASEYHGADGPLPVLPVDTSGPVFDATMETARNLGFKVTDDQHGPEIGEGFAPPELTVENGRRASTATHYLHPVRHRANLKILTGGMVTRVVIENGRAAGVEVADQSGTRKIRAEREVILAAGAYNSSKLLLLSGIGPADELRAFGIDVVADLPAVGRNLQEHPLTGIGYELNRPIGFETNLRFDRLALNVVRFALGVGGRATQLPVTSFGFVRTRDGLDRPDIKANVYPTRLDGRVWFPGIRKGAGHAMTVFAVLLRPESRGSRAFFAAEPLAGLIGKELMPGTEIRSDQEIDDYNRKTCVLAHHACGTCAMGPAADAVVDPELRVYGVDDHAACDRRQHERAGHHDRGKGLRPRPRQCSAREGCGLMPSSD
jgi:choline dehydrogenase